MSVRFPNVPNVPGVPAVARAGALLQSMLAGSNVASTTANLALVSLASGDILSATTDMTASLAGSTSAYNQSLAVFSATADTVGSLSGAVDNASSAISALASGDLEGAAISINQTIDAANSAISSITSIISPPDQIGLDSSGDATNAETVLQWGLYTLQGDLAVEADNVVMFENNLEARISDYPVEDGGFESFNKVIVPYDVRLVMTKGGTVDDRQDFYQAILDAYQATTLYNVITPECVYLDVNVVGVHRQATADRGVGLMAVEVSLRKVRQTATLVFSNTKDASGASSTQNGSVQAQATDGVQQYAGQAK